MRAITTHIVSGDSASQLTIHAVDGPGAGGANHRYHVGGLDVEANPSAHHRGVSEKAGPAVILFQNGPLKKQDEDGKLVPVYPNGVTQEALLAIVQDRLEGFQAGAFACEENAQALEHVKAALEALQSRTLNRLAAGVEGTNQPTPAGKRR